MFLKTLKLFHEILHLQAQSCGLILPVGLGGSLLLALVEKFRARLLAAGWEGPGAGLARRWRRPGAARETS